jgi:hypothetical protein
MERTMPTAVRQRNVPESIRALGTLADADYVDLFTGPTSGAPGSPEQWARAGVEDAAGFAGQFVWRVILGLRLAPPASRAHVGGWEIAARGDRWIRLEAASRWMTAQLVVLVEADRLSIATFVRYDRALAALVWPAASAVHRRAMPGLLRGAVKTRVREAA